MSTVCVRARDPSMASGYQVLRLRPPTVGSVTVVRRSPPTYIPLFWRLFVPNAAVLLGAGIVLMIQSANGRVVALAGGLAVLLTVNLVLMRRAFGPLSRLGAVMDTIDPLDPRRRGAAARAAAAGGAPPAGLHP